MQGKLGEGAFSVVYKVRRKEDGQDYAMKKMKIMGFSDRELNNCLNEVRILASIDDSHIVSYKDSFFDELTQSFCIVSEYMDGGDLHHLISKHKSANKLIEEKFVWRVAYHVLRGLSTLHKQNILHRDIKSANIFMTKDHKCIKLGDMNVSIVSANGMAKTQTGTPYYASPEVWKECPYSAKCDIWSLGCVLHEITTFKPPFIANDMKNLKKMILSGVYRRIPSYYSNELESFIRMCLRVDHCSRPAAEELLKNGQF
jgi:NIMA (never in mitosis gene a)-related kinase